MVRTPTRTRACARAHAHTQITVTLFLRYMARNKVRFSLQNVFVKLKVLSWRASQFMSLLYTTVNGLLLRTRLRRAVASFLREMQPLSDRYMGYYNQVSTYYRQFTNPNSFRGLKRTMKAQCSDTGQHQITSPGYIVWDKVGRATFDRQRYSI